MNAFQFIYLFLQPREMVYLIVATGYKKCSHCAKDILSWFKGSAKVYWSKSPEKFNHLWGSNELIFKASSFLG